MAIDFKDTPYVIEEKDKKLFKVNRGVFTDPEILKLEKKKIFDTCWLYLGHESEIPNPGDFKTRNVGGRPIIFNRDSNGNMHAFLNSCTHRGALVCRERHGNSKIFQCFYHSWTYNNKGGLVGLANGDAKFPSDFKMDMGLKEVPRLESYRGFVFINYDKNAVTLPEYLGKAAGYFDYISYQSEEGLQVLDGTLDYHMRGNWKLASENAVDGSHAPQTHVTYFQYLKTQAGEFPPGALQGEVLDLGNGHVGLEYDGPFGRPVAKWIPAFGEEGKKSIDEIRNRIAAKYGKEMEERITQKNWNVLIFPNLILLDFTTLSLRTHYPINEGEVDVTAWCLAPKEEPDVLKQGRLKNFLEFLGPGGFATPDDNEALELCQQGYYDSYDGADWNDISKGMIVDGAEFDDDEALRIFWRQWNRMITQE